MKGLSLIVALGLLVLAQYLARHLNAAGELPLEDRPDPVSMGAEKTSIPPGLPLQL